MNGEGIDQHHDKGADSSDNEEEEKRMLNLQDRRRKYYEERKKKMIKNNKPMTMAEMLNNVENTLENEKRFINIRVHTRIPKTPYAAKVESEEDSWHLKGELEIADFLTFKELIPKAISMFNAQIKHQGLEIELVTERSSQFSFRYAKKTGVPDVNFPQFDRSQKVSD